MNDPTPTALAEGVTAFCEERFADVAGIAALATRPAVGRRPASLRPRHRAALPEPARGDRPSAGRRGSRGRAVRADRRAVLAGVVAGRPRRRTGRRDPAGRRRQPRLGGVPRLHRRWPGSRSRGRPGSAGITGPYVDYLCTDQYTLTFTAPLTSGDRFLGVAGVDVLARWFEQHLFALVDERGDLDEGCVVVNRAGRVVACPAGTWVTGDLIRELAARPPRRPRAGRSPTARGRRSWWAARPDSPYRMDRSAASPERSVRTRTIRRSRSAGAL